MKKIVLLGLTLCSPLMALAGGDIESVIQQLMRWLGYVAPALIAVMVIMFIWTVIQYSLTTDEEKKKKSRKGIISALIGVFVIVSFWGIIAMVQRSFGIDNQEGNSLIEIPTPIVTY